MTAMDIFNYLQENTRDKLSINKIKLVWTYSPQTEHS